jgi:hypothetical protein
VDALLTDAQDAVDGGEVASHGLRPHGDLQPVEAVQLEAPLFRRRQTDAAVRERQVVGVARLGPVAEPGLARDLLEGDAGAPQLEDTPRAVVSLSSRCQDSSPPRR